MPNILCIPLCVCTRIGQGQRVTDKSHFPAALAGAYPRARDLLLLPQPSSPGRPERSSPQLHPHSTSKHAPLGRPGAACAAVCTAPILIGGRPVLAGTLPGRQRPGAWVYCAPGCARGRTHRSASPEATMQRRSRLLWVSSPVAHHTGPWGERTRWGLEILCV